MAQNIYGGGSGEGISFSSFSESAPSSVSIFAGGESEGTASASLSSVVVTDPEDIFIGGASLGYSEGSYSESASAFENLIFGGGGSRGDASGAAMIDDFADLPVELGSFEVANKGGKAIIKWETLWEIDNDYFVVERSFNRRTWEAVERVKGYGNSNATIRYQTQDKAPLSGISYYRLRQVDYNGTTSYSEIEVFSTNSSGELELLAYPNPLQEQLTIIVDQIYHSRIQLFTITGQMIDFKMIESEKDKVKIALPSLQKGMYVLRVQPIGSLVLMK
ncbi:T9SS type A sorting domain-containing protein [Flammeovirga sp. OC4]|uniref:T9SS type A sorting domain-containing protein n=1 Tax=Flammeovirga sp. OC4 TaxID=1382345 RepID=UPI0005C4D5AB|nr:T9SS type A sorting domain-containing protein [Flammeovirga sp. OC4]